jgi:hypothetical protein
LANLVAPAVAAPESLASSPLQFLDDGATRTLDFARRRIYN